MLKRTLNLITGTAVCALLAMMEPAQADAIKATDIGIVGEVVDLTSVRPLSGVIAGQDTFAVTGGGTIYAFCVDLFHFISLGQEYNFTTGGSLVGTTDHSAADNPLSPIQVAKMAGLMEIANGILQGGFLSQANAHYAGLAGAIDENWAAAIQLAIWNTEYEPNFGVLTFNGGSPLTHTIYADLIADTSIIGDASTLAAVDGQQSFAYATAQINLTSNPVPEPASLTLMGTALVGLGLFGRRRRRRNEDAAV